MRLFQAFVRVAFIFSAIVDAMISFDFDWDTITPSRDLH
jgi:hypothetical protein